MTVTHRLLRGLPVVGLHGRAIRRLVLLGALRRHLRSIASPLHRTFFHSPPVDCVRHVDHVCLGCCLPVRAVVRVLCGGFVSSCPGSIVHRCCNHLRWFSRSLSSCCPAYQRKNRMSDRIGDARTRPSHNTKHVCPGSDASLGSINRLNTRSTNGRGSCLGHVVFLTFLPSFLLTGSVHLQWIYRFVWTIYEYACFVGVSQ